MPSSTGYPVVLAVDVAVVRIMVSVIVVAATAVVVFFAVVYSLATCSHARHDAGDSRLPSGDGDKRQRSRHQQEESKVRVNQNI